ncbi:Protein LURP-one-related 12 [Hibiscus syriacus]|uniref:Protein LURP-one-related 12 n=1 Tax=Hibiscus syriacus TaxID=106335 RepID=A0A6A2Z8J0_HIBSY|nr:Protein LURP-one-related 12 [Hibiscus syriacus]
MRTELHPSLHQRRRVPYRQLVSQTLLCNLQHFFEIKRKVDPSTHVMLGKDVFLLCLRPGFDGAFAMALILVLDQMFDDGDIDDDDENPDPIHAAQDSSS